MRRQSRTRGLLAVGAALTGVTLALLVVVRSGAKVAPSAKGASRSSTLAEEPNEPNEPPREEGLERERRPGPGRPRPRRDADGEDAAARDAATASALNGLVQRETRDEAWASAKEAEITETFADNHIAGAALHDVACASTLCRVRVSKTKEAAFDVVVGDVLHSSETFGTNGYYRLEPESGLIAFYVGRAGFSLANNPVLASAGR